MSLGLLLSRYKYLTIFLYLLLVRGVIRFPLYFRRICFPQTVFAHSSPLC